MRTLQRIVVITACGLLFLGCSKVFGPGAGGFKIVSTSVEPNPVHVGEIAQINVVGRDARNGTHDAMWPNTSFRVSAGQLFFSKEEALGGEPPFSGQEGGGRSIQSYDSAWWLAPGEAQTVTIQVNFGGAQKTIMVEVLP